MAYLKNKILQQRGLGSPRSRSLCLTTSYSLLKLLSSFKIMSATLSVAGNKKTHEIFMRFEHAATTDSRLSLCYSGFRRLRSFCIAPRAPQTWRREAKWNFMKAPSGANAASRPAPICQPANRFYWSWRATTKPPICIPICYFLFLIVSWSKLTCFSSNSLMFHQKENLAAHLLVTQNGLWQQDRGVWCGGGVSVSLLKKFCFQFNCAHEEWAICQLLLSYTEHVHPNVQYVLFRISLRSWYFFPCTCCEEILLQNVYLMRFLSKTFFQKLETELNLKRL